MVSDSEPAHDTTSGQDEVVKSTSEKTNLLSLNMADLMEDIEDALSENKNADYNQFAKTQGIDKKDGRFFECREIFQSLKDGDVKSACLTIHRSISDSKEDPPLDSASSTSAPPDWLYNDNEEDDEKSNSKLFAADTFRDQIQKKLNEQFSDNELNPKSVGDLAIEAANEHCCRSENGNGNVFDLILKCCPCFKRIHIIMEAYHQLVHDEDLWDSMTISQVIQSDQYGHRQLMDDFMHIQLNHIDADNKLNGNENGRVSIGQQMARYFMDKFPCDDMGKCKGNQRHFRARQPKTDEARKGEHDELRNLFRTTNPEEIVFQQEFDKIHSFFMQFSIHFECICIFVIICYVV